MFRIRDITGDEEKQFQYPEHNAQYDTLVNFIFQHVQGEMKNTYGLSEVSVPLAEHEDHLEKSQIFMTEEF